MGGNSIHSTHHSIVSTNELSLRNGVTHTLPAPLTTTLDRQRYPMPMLKKLDWVLVHTETHTTGNTTECIVIVTPITKATLPSGSRDQLRQYEGLLSFNLARIRVSLTCFISGRPIQASGPPTIFVHLYRCTPQPHNDIIKRY